MSSVKKLHWKFAPKASTILPVMTIITMGLPVIYNIASGQNFENGFATSRVVNVQADQLEPLLSVLSLDGQQHSLRTTRLRVEAPDSNQQKPQTTSTNSPSVTKLQEDLAFQGLYGNPVTGELDSATRAAIREYQTVRGLPVTGEPSVQLTEALAFTRQIENAVNFTAGIASSQTSLLARNIQSALKNLGFDPGPIDGKLGKKTRSAIRRFQSQSGILSNGQISQELIRELRIDDTSRLARQTN